MHLRLDCMVLGFDGGKYRDMHPQKVMKELGITYQIATPQSIADQWWFWNCNNVPETLPKFLTPLTIDPKDAIGYGISEDECLEIQKQKI